MTETKNPVLEIRGLKISFKQYEKGFRQTQLDVIRNLDVAVKPGEIVAIVGSSGSGKSLLAHAVLGILPYNASQGGEILYNGEPLTKKRVEKLRGEEIVLVPQSLSYLDPLMKTGKQIRKGKDDPASREKLTGSSVNSLYFFVTASISSIFLPIMTPFPKRFVRV